MQSSYTSKPRPAPWAAHCRLIGLCSMTFDPRYSNDLWEMHSLALLNTMITAAFLKALIWMDKHPYRHKHLVEWETHIKRTYNAPAAWLDSIDVLRMMRPQSLVPFSRSVTWCAAESESGKLWVMISRVISRFPQRHFPCRFCRRAFCEIKSSLLTVFNFLALAVPPLAAKLTCGSLVRCWVTRRTKILMAVS